MVQGHQEAREEVGKPSTVKDSLKALMEVTFDLTLEVKFVNEKYVTIKTNKQTKALKHVDFYVPNEHQ